MITSMLTLSTITMIIKNLIPTILIKSITKITQKNMNKKWLRFLISLSFIFLFSASISAAEAPSSLQHNEGARILLIDVQFAFVYLLENVMIWNSLDLMSRLMIPILRKSEILFCFPIKSLHFLSFSFFFLSPLHCSGSCWIGSVGNHILKS